MDCLTAHMEAENNSHHQKKKMQDKNQSPAPTTALVVGRGKHAALWSRMKSKQQHKQQQQNSPSNNDQSIPNAVTLTSDDEEEEQEDNNKPPKTAVLLDKENQEENVLTTFLGTPRHVSSSLLPTGETPGLFWKQWQQEEANDEEEETPSKLLQADLILSPDDDDDNTSDQDQTRLSLASLDDDGLSLPGTSPLLFDDVFQDAVPPSGGSPLSAMRRNSMHQALQESQVYLQRIHALEEMLMATKAQLVVAQTSGHRTSSLGGGDDDTSSDAVTPSTSRFQALWQRNQTLVKEVRFAEQTCVEISQRHKALQAHVNRLEQDCKHKDQEMDRLQHELRHAESVIAEWRALSDPLQLEELKAVCQERLEQIQTLEEEKATASNEITELKEQLAQAKVSRPVEHGLSNNSKIQADMAILSKELEISRASESALKKSVSELEEKLLDTEKERDELKARVEQVKSANESKSQLDALKAENEDLKASLRESKQSVEELEKCLVVEKEQREEIGLAADRKMKELEDIKILEVCRIQEEYFDRTQMALRCLEVQSIDLQRQAQSKVNAFNHRLMVLTGSVDRIRNSLDFESDSSSNEGEDELSGSESLTSGSDQTSDRDERLSGESLIKTPERDSIGIPNATFNRTGSVKDALDDEILMEQMEEARQTDQADEKDIDGLSQIESIISELEISSMGSDLSDQPELKDESAFYVKSILPYLDSIEGASAIDHPSPKPGPTSVGDECRRLQDALYYLRGSTAPDQELVRATIDDQKLVLDSIEKKFAVLTREMAIQNESEREALVASLAESRNVCSRLESELHGARLALQDTKRELEHNEQVIQSLRAERTQLVEQCDALSMSAKEAIRMCESQKVRTQDLEQVSNEQLESLKEEISKEKERSSQLQSELEALQLVKNASPHEDALRLVESRLTHLEEAYATSQNELARLSETNYKGSELAARYEKELGEAKAHAAMLDDEIASAKSSAMQVEAALSVLEMELDDARRKNEDQSSAITVLEEEKADLVSKYAAAHSALCDASNARKNLEGQVTKLSAERDLLLEKLKTLNDKAASESKMYDYLSTVQQLQTELQAAREEMDRLKLSYVACNDKLANVSEQNASKDAIVEQYRKAHEAAKEMVEHAEMRFIDASQHLGVALSEKAALEKRVHAISKELQLTEEELHEYQESKDRAQDQVDEALRKERQRANELSEKLRDAERAVAEAEAEIIQTTTALAAAQQELTLVARQAPRDETIRELQAKNESLEHKCARLREYIRKLTGKCDEWEKSYEQQSKLLQQTAAQGPCPSQRSSNRVRM